MNREPTPKEKAQARFGKGWSLLSEDIQNAFIAYEKLALIRNEWRAAKTCQKDSIPVDVIEEILNFD
jgi:hypothetical protein